MASCTVIGQRPHYLGRARRLVGLLVDHGFGLALWQPAALAVVPAAAAMARRRPPGSVLLLAMLGAGWLNATFVALTMHGWWWPGRQVVVVVPLAVLAIAWWADRLGSTGRRLLAAAGVIGVAAYGFLVLGVLSGRHTLIVDFDRTIDPFVHIARGVLPDGRTTTVTSWILTTAWSAVLVAWAAWAWGRAGEPTTWPGGAIRPQSPDARPGPPPRRRHRSRV